MGNYDLKTEHEHDHYDHITMIYLLTISFFMNNFYDTFRSSGRMMRFPRKKFSLMKLKARKYFELKERNV